MIIIATLIRRPARPLSALPCRRRKKTPRRPLSTGRSCSLYEDQQRGGPAWAFQSTPGRKQTLSAKREVVHQEIMKETPPINRLLCYPEGQKRARLSFSCA